jgi:hypothetical protein
MPLIGQRMKAHSNVSNEHFGTVNMPTMAKMCTKPMYAIMGQLNVPFFQWWLMTDGISANICRDKSIVYFSWM